MVEKVHHYISYIFHPILVPMVGTLLFFIVAPYHIPKEFAYRVILLTFVLTYIFPLLMLFFLKKINLIENYQLPSINERKFPLLFVAIICLTMGKLLLRTDAVDLLAYSFFASALSLILTYLFFFKNIKSSMHTMGIAGLITFLSIISYSFKINLLLLIFLSFLLLGIVSTSRLKLEAHSVKEIFIGIFIGIVSQLIIYFTFVMNYNM
ncbi:MAG: hypothetical protein KDC47_06425 [Flavobacteriaceae bacterium]|nr:hypothetical protein [Flavobacteriaceae bacterium]